VGAAEGTPPLYAVFPKAFHVLVEPLREFEPQLKELTDRLGGTYRIAAANDTGEPVSFNVHTDHLHGSSQLKEEMGIDADGSPRVVPGLRLDDLLREINFRTPALLKIDVQGAELIVLRGASVALRSRELVLLETSLFQLMKGAALLSDIVAYMVDAGFVPYDVFSLCYRPLDSALAHRAFGVPGPRAFATFLISAADLLNDRVFPVCDSHEVTLLRVLIGRGSEYSGNPRRHEYELYLARCAGASAG